VRVLPSGPGAVLFEVDDLEQAEELYGELRRRGHEDLGDVVEIVPGARTVLVIERPDSGLIARLVGELRHWAPTRTRRLRPAGRLHHIPVCYDGDDLPAVAEAAGLSPEEVIRLHADAEMHVAFCGFSPGFAYLAGLPRVLALPRRASPRMTVPPGAVAIAGEFSAIYPRTSPGGWHILGRTTVHPWDDERDPPALFTPGDRVQFRACPS